MIKLIIFDFDGTLIDSRKANLEVGKLVLKHFKIRHSQDEMKLWYLLATKEIVKHFFPWYKRRKALKFIEEHRQDFFQLMKLNKNVIKMMKYLKSHKYKIALATNRGQSTYPLLDKFKLRKYFDFIATASMIRKHKPYPHQINYIRRKLKVKRDEILYVGDSPIDSIAAKRAKVKCAIYRHNEIKADHHVSDYKNIKKLLTPLLS